MLRWPSACSDQAVGPMALLFRSQPKREGWDPEKSKSVKVSKEICYVGAGMRGEEEKGVILFFYSHHTFLTLFLFVLSLHITHYLFYHVQNSISTYLT